MPLHLPDAAHKYRPAVNETILVIIKRHDAYADVDYLDVITGKSLGLDSEYWKEGYKIVDSSGAIDTCCPGLLYPRTLAEDEVRRHIAERLRPYVFATQSDYKDGRGHKEASLVQESCDMCANRQAFWAVSPPVFLSHESRRWHLHVDCFHHLMPRRQFGLKPVEKVDYS